MSASDPSNLRSSDFELDDDHIETPLITPAFMGAPSRSPYHLPASEQLRGVANRIIFSRYYILFYFIMMSLSLATVVLSLIATSRQQCPPASWHILEVVVNFLMVVEVSTRWIAYGKKYPMTLLNVLDLGLVLFCVITLILVFVNPCGEGTTRQEEMLDTILLVIRNGVQFLRLANILRRSGHSLFNPPKPMDLSQARQASLALDLDIDDEEAIAERDLTSGRSLAGYQPVYADDRTPPRVQSHNSLGSNEHIGEDQSAWNR
ncbi:hypothetical protein Q8F55_005728 [Vanrija albida]|uniref:Ion transport domain-containing protein n=1 Tax=Vanrija albida TaxID=181172 RepID=A0ABR3Q2F5_9TREE